MSKIEPTLFSALPSGFESDLVSRRTYINNLLVNECLEHLPAAVDYPKTEDFKAYLREHLHHNSKNTRLKYAEYIAYRYSREGRVNSALARFLRLCPDDRSRREALWFETVRAVPLLKELCMAWVSKISGGGSTRDELLAFLQPRVGGRKPDKIATEAIGALKKFGHLKSPKLKHYVPIWREPTQDALVYGLSQYYQTPTAVRMEAFKTDPLWQALLWPSMELEQLILQAERTREIARVTQLDNYYQFVLHGTGEERLDLLLSRWSARGESR